MKAKLFLVSGIAALGFGLVNILWYLPHSFVLVLMNQPFPFQHLEEVQIHEGRGIGTGIHYQAFEAAVSDPYWLVWSLSLYVGIGMIVFAVWRIKK